MWPQHVAVRAPAWSRACRVGGVLAGALLLATTTAAIGARAAAPGSGPAREASGDPLPSSPAPRPGPADLGRALQPVPPPRLAVLDIVARGLGLEPLSSTRRAVEPAVLSSSIVSGLPWRSGAACGSPDMAAWRGRRLDTGWFGVRRTGWAEMLKAVRGGTLKARAAAAPQLVVSLTLLPLSHSMQHGPCAAGAFDGHFREIGAALRANGAGGTVVRLGKEANRGGPPYGYDSEDNLPAYRGCFRRAARALKGGAPGLTIEWTNGRQTLSPVNVLDAYPGGDVVDIIGVHYYNNPRLGRMSTQAHWDAQYLERYPSGGPKGLGAWLAEARKRGKRLAVSEWGLWGTTTEADTPVYVENMFRFFKSHAADIAYESYFNCVSLHEIFPSTMYTKARGRYRELWSTG